MIKFVQMNERIRGKTKTTEKLSTIERIGLIASMSAIAIAAGNLISNNHDSDDSHEQNRHDISLRIEQARQIADGFTCSIESIDNTDEPVPFEHSGSDRDSIRVTANLQQKPDVEPLLAQYENNNGIIWYSPEPRVYLEPDADEDDSNIYDVKNRVSAEEYFSGNTFDQVRPRSFYPQSRYETGKRARVVVMQETQIPGAKAYGAGPQFVTGFIPCGELEYDATAREWHETDLPSDITTEFYEGDEGFRY